MPFYDHESSGTDLDQYCEDVQLFYLLLEAIHTLTYEYKRLNKSYIIYSNYIIQYLRSIIDKTYNLGS